MEDIEMSKTTFLEYVKEIIIALILIFSITWLIILFETIFKNIVFYDGTTSIIESSLIILKNDVLGRILADSSIILTILLLSIEIRIRNNPYA